MLVSALATLGDESEVAVGNIIGSDIANLSILLGIGAITLPPTVRSSTVTRREGIVLIVGDVALVALLA
ncbi:MAG: cation:H+ antiporter [Ilumatobacter sp.]|jgi:cation:H+ antiporter